MLGISTTLKGNSFLECRTDGGLMAAFWGSSRSMRNIQAVGQHKPPFTVRCACIDPSMSFPNHDVWIPENSTLEFDQSKRQEA